jgi:hypothetical protein
MVDRGAEMKLVTLYLIEAPVIEVQHFADVQSRTRVIQYRRIEMRGNIMFPSRF